MVICNPSNFSASLLCSFGYLTRVWQRPLVQILYGSLSFVEWSALEWEAKAARKFLLIFLNPRNNKMTYRLYRLPPRSQLGSSYDWLISYSLRESVVPLNVIKQMKNIHLMVIVNHQFVVSTSVLLNYFGPPRARKPYHIVTRELAKKKT